MSLETMMAGAVLTVGVVAGGWAWHSHAVSTARQEGYSAAVADGKKRYDEDAAKALSKERKLRDEQAAKDDAARKDKERYDEALADAQRRMRAGTDRLRCPAASPVHAAATAPAGPAAGGPAPDEPGTPVVPEVAADILGLAADSDSIVRKFDRLTERYDACRALNNGVTDMP